MCFHRRLIYDCVHHVWAGMTQPCEVEEAFNRGRVNIGCSQRWSHAYDTRRTQLKCPKCAEKEKGCVTRIGAARDQIKALKELLKAIKGDTKIKDEEWLNMDSVLKKSKPDTMDGVETSSMDETNDSSDDEFRNMEEVRVDPKHWAMKLPLIIAAQKV